MPTALLDFLNTMRPAAVDLALCAVAFATLAFIARGMASLRTAREASVEVSTNITLFAIDFLFVAPALALAVGAMGASFQRNGLLILTPQDWAAWPQWTVALFALFIGDFVAYWRHRLEHIALLWPAHAIHHSDSAMTWTTGLRFHPINRFTTGMIDTGALALLGFPPWALVVNNLVRHYYGLFIHMDLPWTYGPLGRVFVSPAMHRWHHVREGAGVGANFATVFSVFDQVFGTHHAPGPCTALLGVPEPIGRNAIAQLLWPFRAAFNALQRARWIRTR